MSGVLRAKPEHAELIRYFQERPNEPRWLRLNRLYNDGLFYGLPHCLHNAKPLPFPTGASSERFKNVSNLRWFSRNPRNPNTSFVDASLDGWPQFDVPATIRSRLDIATGEL